jgi:peroxiredoxin Q/BCP
MTTKLSVGDKAPDFNLANQDGKEISLDSLLSQPVVLYYYPKDDTPGCTTEAINFTAKLASYDKAGIVVVGVSPDSCESHVKFIKKHDLQVMLLSDPEHELIESYGQWVEKNMYGKKYMGVNRSTFLIKKDGTIAFIWEKVKVDTHAEDVLAKIQEIGI